MDRRHGKPLLLSISRKADVVAKAMHCIILASVVGAGLVKPSSIAHFVAQAYTLPTSVLFWVMASLAVFIAADVSGTWHTRQARWVYLGAGFCYLILIFVASERGLRYLPDVLQFCGLGITAAVIALRHKSAYSHHPGA